MDIRLKGAMDGIEAAALIRKQFGVPVVYLTSYADDSTLQRAKVTGPLGYVLKPLDNRELRNAIEIALHQDQIERALKANEQWLGAVLRGTKDAVVAADSDGLITLMNPTAEHLLGWEEYHAIGKNLVDLFVVRDGPSLEPVENPVARVLKGGCAVALTPDARLIGEIGKSTPIDGEVLSIRDEGGNITGLVLTIRDVSHVRQMERENASALDKAMEADRLKSQLLSTVSHELRTPLASIKGFATTLLDNEDKLDQVEKREFLQEIDGAVDRLTGLIDHLLEFSRADGGMLRIEPVATSLGGVISGVLGRSI